MDAEPNLRQQEMLELRARITELRRQLLPMEQQELEGKAHDTELLATLRAQLKELKGQHDYLASVLEGPREEVVDTPWENTVDFLKEYWTWLAAGAALAFLGLVYPISQYFGQPTAEERQTIRQSFTGATDDDLEQSSQFMEESLSHAARHMEKELEADARDAQREMERLERKAAREAGVRN